MLTCSRGVISLHCCTWRTQPAVLIALLAHEALSAIIRQVEMLEAGRQGCRDKGGQRQGHSARTAEHTPLSSMFMWTIIDDCSKPGLTHPHGWLSLGPSRSRCDLVVLSMHKMISLYLMGFRQEYPQHACLGATRCMFITATGKCAGACCIGRAGQ